MYPPQKPTGMQPGMLPGMPGAPPPQQQDTPFNRAMSSPGMAMAGSAINNMSAMMQGGMPQSDPMQSYQSVIQANAKLSESMRQNRVNEGYKSRADARAQEEHDDPQREYTQAIENGTIPPSTSYEDFLMMGSQGRMPSSAVQNFQQWKATNPHVNPKQEQGVLAEIIRKSHVYETGAGGTRAYNALNPGGSVDKTLETDESALGGAGKKETVLSEAEHQAMLNKQEIDDATATINGNRSAYELADTLQIRSQLWLDKMEATGADEMDTGPIAESMLNTFGVATEDVAAFDADSIMSTLENLNIANLAPVTEQELKTVAKMWGRIGAQKSANVGVLKRAVARTEKLKKRIMEQTKISGDQLRDVDPKRFDRYSRNVPWFGDQYKDYDTSEMPE